MGKPSKGKSNMTTNQSIEDATKNVQAEGRGVSTKRMKNEYKIRL